MGVFRPSLRRKRRLDARAGQFIVLAQAGFGKSGFWMDQNFSLVIFDQNWSKIWGQNFQKIYDFLKKSVIFWSKNGRFLIFSKTPKTCFWEIFGSKISVFDQKWKMAIFGAGNFQKQSKIDQWGPQAEGLLFGGKGSSWAQARSDCEGKFSLREIWGAKDFQKFLKILLAQNFYQCLWDNFSGDKFLKSVYGARFILSKNRF